MSLKLILIWDKICGKKKVFELIANDVTVSVYIRLKYHGSIYVKERTLQVVRTLLNVFIIIIIMHSFIHSILVSQRTFIDYL